MTNHTTSLGIKISKVGIVKIAIKRVTKKSIILNDVNALFFLEEDLIKNIFAKFGEITKFEPDNASKTIVIHFENEMSVHDVMTIPDDTIETVKLEPLTMTSIRAKRDAKYITDINQFMANAESILSKYYEQLHKPSEKVVDDNGWQTVSKKRKVKMVNIVPNHKDEEFDDDDEEIDSDNC